MGGKVWAEKVVKRVGELAERASERASIPAVIPVLYCPPPRFIAGSIDSGLPAEHHEKALARAYPKSQP